MGTTLEPMSLEGERIQGFSQFDPIESFLLTKSGQIPGTLSWVSVEVGSGHFLFRYQDSALHMSFISRPSPCIIIKSGFCIFKGASTPRRNEISCGTFSIRFFHVSQKRKEREFLRSDSCRWFRYGDSRHFLSFIIADLQSATLLIKMRCPLFSQKSTDFDDDPQGPTCQPLMRSVSGYVQIMKCLIHNKNNNGRSHASQGCYARVTTVAALLNEETAAEVGSLAAEIVTYPGVQKHDASEISKRYSA